MSARLVANGFKQKFGVNFFETYSPVVNINTIRVVLPVVVAKQLDVDTAFLNSGLKEKVFMEVTYGITNAQNMILKLAAGAWHQTVHAVFMKIGFRSCGADQCVYVKDTKDNYVCVCLYVDDMIIAAKTKKEIYEVKVAFKSAFKMKELGEVKFILGMDIDHDRIVGKLMINQTRYIDDVMNRLYQQDAKAVVNPSESGMKLMKVQPPTTNTEREDMRTKSYRNDGKVMLEAYTDADWGSNLDDRRISARNAGYNARTKHADIRHHFIRENVARDIITMDYVGTVDQLTDMLTKALGTKRLQFVLAASGVRTKPRPASAASGSADVCALNESGDVMPAHNDDKMRTGRTQ
uniref:Reverse transcriptase Ty1/copia-type domain-containing protein n=1 Tax=Phytophthora ramorum TaxID=164328 RepID=H3H4S2_PHYRM